MGACGRSPVWALAGVLLALPGCASGDASTESCASNLGCDGRTQRGYQSAQEDDWREPDEGELEQALLRDRATSRGCTRYSAEDTAALAGGTIALDDQPFIISDPDALLASPAGDMLARGALLRKYGTHRLSWSSSRANAGNVRERTGPLRYFVQEVMRGEQSRDFRAFSSEWFLDPRHKAMAEATSIRLHALAARATGDTAFLDQEPQDQFMSIGANGSSVSFHGHGPALFGLYVGMKRFYLVPPTEPQPRVEGGVDFFELDSWLAMVRGLPDRDKAAATAALRSCILQPGDMIFIPDGWWHATKDLTETVGTTALFSQGFPGGVGLVSDDGIEAEELGGALPPTFDDAADCEIYFDEPECLADRSTAGDAEPCEWHSEIGLCTTLGMSVRNLNATCGHVSPAAGMLCPHDAPCELRGVPALVHCIVLYFCRLMLLTRFYAQTTSSGAV